MSRTSEISPLGQRLRRLPGQFLLALVNATAILVIVAAVLALFVLGRVEGAANQVSAAIATTLTSRLSLDRTALATEVAGLRSDLAGYRTALGAQKDEVAERIGARLDRLEAQLASLDAGIAELTEVKGQITDESFRQASAALTDGMLELFHCGRPVAAAEQQVLTSN